MIDYFLFGFLALFPVGVTIYAVRKKKNWSVDDAIAYYSCAGLLFLGAVIALAMKIRGG